MGNKPLLRVMYLLFCEGEAGGTIPTGSASNVSLIKTIVELERGTISCFTSYLAFFSLQTPSRPLVQDKLVTGQRVLKEGTWLTSADLSLNSRRQFSLGLLRWWNLWAKLILASSTGMPQSATMGTELKQNFKVNSLLDCFPIWHGNVDGRGRFSRHVNLNHYSNKRQPRYINDVVITMNRPTKDTANL